MDIVAFTRWPIAVFLAALALTVAVLMLTGKIRMRGLLHDKRSGRMSPMRIQLLLVTLSGAAAYLSNVVEQLAQHPEVNSLPPASPDLLVALGSSHALYLTGKVASAFNLGAKLFTRT